MHQSQQELRHAAAKAFMEALDQLGTSLAAEDSSASTITPKEEASRSTPLNQPTASPQKIDPQPMSVEALEDAVADIEQFMNNLSK